MVRIREAFGNGYSEAQSVPEMTLALGSRSVVLVQSLAPVTLVYGTPPPPFSEPWHSH